MFALRFTLQLNVFDKFGIILQVISFNNFGFCFQKLEALTIFALMKYFLPHVPLTAFDRTIFFNIRTMLLPAPL
jgi:hypothetical protein